MQQKKNQIILLAIGLLAFAGIWFIWGGEDKGVAEKIAEARANHAHERALLYATELLKSEPSNEYAKTVLRESGQIFVYLQTAQATLREELEATNRGNDLDPEKRYERIDLATQTIAKAKALDPQFKRTLSVEKKLNAVRTALVSILARDAMKLGDSIVSLTSAKYYKASQLVDSAASSDYLMTFLSAQSAWASSEAPIEQIKAEISPQLDDLTTIERLASESTQTSAEKLRQSLSSYIRAAKKSLSVLLTPRGSYDDFSRTSHDAIAEYQAIQKTLAKTLRKLGAVENRFLHSVRAAASYKLFGNDSSAAIITANQSLYQR